MDTPEYLTKTELLHVLSDIKTHVEANDSFEGFLEYTMPWIKEYGDPEDDPREGFRVRARYRVGNLEGQGGMRVVGKLV